MDARRPVLLKQTFWACIGRVRIGGFGRYDIIYQPDGVTWHDATDYCIEAGKALLGIVFAEENEAIKDYLRQNEGKLKHRTLWVITLISICMSNENICLVLARDVPLSH